jgi:hypothetical protein
MKRHLTEIAAGIAVMVIGNLILDRARDHKMHAPNIKVKIPSPSKLIRKDRHLKAV